MTVPGITAIIWGLIGWILYIVTSLRYLRSLKQYDKELEELRETAELIINWSKRDEDKRCNCSNHSDSL